MRKLDYKINSATIATLLGKTNYPTKQSAIAELIKNAYDAGATRLEINFLDDLIVISDNGKGMSIDDIESKWMYVGESEKRNAIITYDVNGNERTLSGSKGVGRFALAKLGSQVVVLSKASNSKGLRWETDWNGSIVQDEPQFQKRGTRIEISMLHERWGKTFFNTLKEYLSKLYDSEGMEILLRFYNEEPEHIYPYFDQPNLGYNCTQLIDFEYDASTSILNVNIRSDEFKESAQILINDVDICNYNSSIDISNEVRFLPGIELGERDLAHARNKLGSFDGQFYFRLTNSTEDEVEKFQYKHQKLPEPFESGIILYRDDFAISSYEGSRDWLGLGKRSRKSPASPSHQSGAWRVRENQIAGKIHISRSQNSSIKELANRQGIEENLEYSLFIEIIDAVLKEFERYRQGIIRKITLHSRKKNNTTDTNENLARNILKRRPKDNELLTKNEFSALQTAFKSMDNKINITEKEKAEQAEEHQYASRVLNVFATAGLKATSLAHELEADKGDLQDIAQYIHKALVKYGYWNELTSKEKTEYPTTDIPGLLRQEERLGRKYAQLIEAMLGETRKGRFRKETCFLKKTLEKITNQWKENYSRIAHINLHIPEGMKVSLSEDETQVIFDNLILNSIQQNSNRTDLELSIEAKSISDSHLTISYSDNGKGLDIKYLNNPMRILEVHETSRGEDGHGLGMWILNNTLKSRGGAVTHILSRNGFYIDFEIIGGLDAN